MNRTNFTAPVLSTWEIVDAGRKSIQRMAQRDIQVRTVSTPESLAPNSRRSSLVHTPKEILEEARANPTAAPVIVLKASRAHVEEEIQGSEINRE
jgi:hypothetical protein